MPTATVRQRGRITIPEKIRTAARLEEGDQVEIELTDQGILLRPAREPDLDMSWFATPDGKARVRDALDAVKSGRPWIFESGEEFVAVLEQFGADDADV